MTDSNPNIRNVRMALTGATAMVDLAMLKTGNLSAEDCEVIADFLIEALAALDMGGEIDA